MNAKIRTLSAILLTVCMLVSGMPFAAFAENEPATPTDLSPIVEETQAETGTGNNGEAADTETQAGEEPAGEPTTAEEPAGNEPADEGETAGEGTDGEGSGKDGTEENPGTQLPELRYGKTGYRGTLKAGEEFKIVLRPEYSWNILVTLVLNSKAGNTLDATSVRMCLNGEKKNTVRIENEDPENTGVTLQFGAYTAKDSEYILSITSPADADFILTAVKRPEADAEETNGEDGNEEEANGEDENKEEPNGEEKTEVEDDGEGGEMPAGNAESEVSTDPETTGEPETPDTEAEIPGGETEETTESEEQPADEYGNKEADQVHNALDDAQEKTLLVRQLLQLWFLHAVVWDDGIQETHNLFVFVIVIVFNIQL